MNVQTSIRSALLGISCLLAPLTLHAQMVYTSGHTDIGVGYEDGELYPHWHLDAGNIVDGQPLEEESEYEPGDLVAQFSGTRGAAAGSSDYLGASSGTTIYMGGPSVAWQPYLGFGTEELNPGDWVDGRITLTLTGWTTPDGGSFALYTTNGAGTTTTDVFLSTFNPASANIDGIGQNSFYLFAGGHEHYTFGFTTPGDYELTFEFSGQHVQDGLVSASGTFGFNVVPEPSTVALMTLAGISTLFLRRRSPRSSLGGS